MALSMAAVLISLMSAYYTWQRVAIEREREAYRRRQERTAHLYAVWRKQENGYEVLITNYGEAPARDVGIACLSRSNGETRWTDRVPVIGPRSTFHSEHHWNHRRDDLIVQLSWSDLENAHRTYETTL